MEIPGEREMVRSRGQAMIRRAAEAMALSRRLKLNVSRNDPCPCGSGKRFKRCCLDKAEGR